MPSVSENLELMQKHFPQCPVCGSSEGYEPSAFYLGIRCKICGAEWSLFEDGIELKRASEREWDKELLNKRFSFEFWKKLKIPELKLTTEKTFAPMDYLGGHTEYRKPAIGYILLKHDSISYKTGEGSLNKVDVEIPIERFKGIEIRTGKEISFLRWFLIGAWSILFKAKKEYLVLIYEDTSEMLQHMGFDFHGRKKMIHEMISLISYLKKKRVNKNT